MSYSAEDLTQKYLATIKEKPHNTKQLFGLGFIGINGVGKSFVAKKISEKLGLPINSNDAIRRFLNRHGFEGANPDQDLVQKIGQATGDYIYKNKISYIIDADLIKFQERAREIASMNGATLYLIHLTCPEEIILNRLQKRKAELEKDPASNLSRVDETEYFKRKELHETIPVNNIFFTIDTSHDLESQINNLIIKLKQKSAL